jgi:hypothetical protein
VTRLITRTPHCALLGEVRVTTLTCRLVATISFATVATGLADRQG